MGGLRLHGHQLFILISQRLRSLLVILLISLGLVLADCLVKVRCKLCIVLLWAHHHLVFGRLSFRISMLWYQDVPLIYSVVGVASSKHSCRNHSLTTWEIQEVIHDGVIAKVQVSTRMFVFGIVIIVGFICALFIVASLHLQENVVLVFLNFPFVLVINAILWGFVICICSSLCIIGVLIGSFLIHQCVVSIWSLLSLWLVNLIIYELYIIIFFRKGSSSWPLSSLLQSYLKPIRAVRVFIKERRVEVFLVRQIQALVHSRIIVSWRGTHPIHHVVRLFYKCRTPTGLMVSTLRISLVEKVNLGMLPWSTTATFLHVLTLWLLLLLLMHLLLILLQIEVI